jgi:hypothetical protein
MSSPPPHPSDSRRTTENEYTELFEIMQNGFLIRGNHREQERAELRRNIMRQLREVILIRAFPQYHTEYDKLTEEEKKKFHDFLKLSLICPICKAKNHELYLKNFYFSKNPDNIILKNKLLDLMEKSKNFCDNITLGIPCCNCYKKVFDPEKSSTSRELILIDIRQVLRRALESRNR